MSVIMQYLLVVPYLPIVPLPGFMIDFNDNNVSIGHAPAYLSDMLTACADVPSFSRL